MEKESNILFNILFVALFLGIMLMAMVWVIFGLNSGNRQSGTSILGDSVIETLNDVADSPQTLTVGGIENPNCVINQVSVHGYIIPSSNYTINNCQLTYNP